MVCVDVRMDLQFRPKSVLKLELRAEVREAILPEDTHVLRDQPSGPYARLEPHRPVCLRLIVGWAKVRTVVGRGDKNCRSQADVRLESAVLVLRARDQSRPSKHQVEGDFRHGDLHRINSNSAESDTVGGERVRLRADIRLKVRDLQSKTIG